MSGGLWFSGDTAIAWACRELIRGREISHADEIEEVSAWRLGAIIHVLRKRYKWPIVTTLKGPSRIGYYRLGRIDGPLELPKSARGGGTGNAAGTAGKATKKGGRHE